MRTPPDSPPPTQPAALDRADWLIAAALFAGLSLVYFMTLAGITSSNDGSHYALLRTMVANRAFTLNQKLAPSPPSPSQWPRMSR